MKPDYLRTKTERGQVNKKRKEQQEQEQRKKLARQLRMERSAKDHEEAKRLIANIEWSMDCTADDGRNSIRVYKVPTSDPDALEGVAKILYNHFKKEGFNVQIERVDGPEIAYEPDYNYFINVSW